MPIQRPMLPVAAGLMGGIALGACWPGYADLAWPMLLVLTAGMACCILKRRPATVLPLLFLAAAGYLSVQPWLAPRLPGQHVSRYADQGRWEIQGIVVEEPLRRHERLKFVLDTRRLTGKQGDVQVRGYLQVTAALPAPTLTRGDRVRFSAHIRSVRSFSNPGGGNYERIMALRGILVRAYVGKTGLQPMPAVQQPAGFHTIDRLRLFLSRQMDQALTAQSPDSLHLLKALTLGERGSLPDQVRDAFARAGVGHLLAISGLHIGIVALCTYGLAMRMLVFWPWLLTRAWTRRAASLVALVAVCLYGTLAGLSPSTQRAMVMALVFLAGWWVGRSHDWFNTLAIAALVLLVVTPHAMLNVSFQLSFAAVTTILLGLNRLHGWTFLKPDHGLRARLAARFAVFVLVTLMATLGTLPLIMHHFNQVSLVGPAANLVVVPLAGSVAVPLGLSGCLLAGISPCLAAWLWQAAALVLDVALWVVHSISQWSHAAVTCVTPTPIEIGLYYLGLGLVSIPGRRWIKITALLTILAAAGVDAAYWMYRRYYHSDLCVTALDVGQGSANLLQLPGGFVALVDGGGFGDPRIFDVGERIVAPALWRNKIKTVDLVVLSHPNADHLNGLVFILEHFSVGEVWSNHQPTDTLGYERWSDAIKHRGIPHLPFVKLQSRSIRGNTSLEILSPPKDFLIRSREETWRDLNENSLVLKVSHGAISFLFPGDIGWRTEREMMQRLGADRLHSTVLFLPHHGSRKSGSMPFLEAVQPREAVISTGWQNPFHFPHTRTMERLIRTGATAWRTDLCGAVSFYTNGQDYHIETCRPCNE